MFAEWIFHQQQDAPRSRQHVSRSDAPLHQTATAPFHDGKDKNGRQGKGRRTRERQQSLAAFLHMRNDVPCVQREGCGDATRRHLRQRDAQENEPTQDEIHTHQRTGQPNQQADVNRVPQQKVRSQDFTQRFHLKRTEASTFPPACRG